MFKRLSVQLFILIFAVINIEPLFSQQGDLDSLVKQRLGIILNQAGSGTKASAMGGAFTAIANDATALEWNPAGLVNCKKSSAYLSGRFRFGSLSANPSENFLQSNTITGSDRAAFSLNYIGFVIPFHANNKNIIGSVAVRSLSDFSGSQIWKIVSNDSTVQTQYQTETAGSLYALSPGIGIELKNNLSLGMSINFITGLYKSKHLVTTEEGENKLETWQKAENKFSGSTVEVGALWAALPNLSFGTKISLPYAFHISNLKYSESKGESGEYKIDASLKIPTRFVTGFAVKPTRDFVFSFDYQINPWSKAILKIDDFEKDRVFKSSTSFHTGIEYLVRTQNALLPIRFGFFIHPTQLYEYNENADNLQGDRIISNILTAGMGVIMKAFSIEFSFDYHLEKYDAFGEMSMPFPTDKPFEINNSKYRFTISGLIYLR